MAQANQLTQKIFALIKKDKVNEASEIMTNMDSKFHSALFEISHLRSKVREIQKEQLLLYHAKAKGIFVKQFYVAGFILCLVGLILFFGCKIKNSFETLLRELESVIIIDDKGIIEYINPMAEKIFDYRLSEVVEKNINIFVSQPHKAKHNDYIEHYIETRESKIVGSIREVSGITEDGTQFSLELGISQLQLQERLMFTGVIRDITEKKKSDLYLSSIAQIQEMYINGANQKEIFDTILIFLLTYTSSEYGFIGAIFHDDNQIPYLKTFAITNVPWNVETRTFYNQKAPEGLEFKNLNTLFGHTIKTGEIVISNDPSSAPRSCGLPEGHPDMHSYLGMPITGNDGLIAMYGMANRA